MITLKSCPVCQGNRFELYRQVFENPVIECEYFRGLKLNFAIMSNYLSCQDCRLIFQSPRFSDSELNKFYSEGYYRAMVDMTKEEMDRDEETRAKLDAQIIKKNIGEIKTHLDIGCSRGFLLDEIGADIKVGVEENISYVKAKDVKVYPDIDKVTQKSFDLVTVIHVLEHVPYPLIFLETIIKFVSKDGYLVIEVPTLQSPGGPLRLAHLCYFETDVLKLLCKRVGLEIINLEFTPHLLLICKLKK